MNEEAKFCIKCGGALSRKVEGGRERPWCPVCNKFVFGRFTIGVGGLVVHDGKVLLIQRGHEPGKGRWTLPGGYVEEDEAPDETVVREVLEETGLKTKVRGIVAIRHAETRDGQNAYYIFGLELLSSPADLRFDGDEIANAVFVDPLNTGVLGDIGAISKWIVENCRPDDVRLARIPDELAPKFPAVQKWTVVYGGSSGCSQSPCEDDDAFAKSRELAIKAMEKGLNLGGKPMTRDQIHDRKSPH